MEMEFGISLMAQLSKEFERMESFKKFFQKKKLMKIINKLSKRSNKILMTIVIKINNKKKRKSKPIVLHLKQSKKN